MAAQPLELTVRAARLSDTEEVAAMHVARIGEGFLVQLGPRFLRRLYARMVRSENAFLLVAESAQQRVGFVGVSLSTRRFYRDFLVHDSLAAGMTALPTVVRAPRRVLETLRYGVGADGELQLPDSEILAVAAAGHLTGRGVGTALVRSALSELQQRGVRGARVVTGAANDAAIRMYERVGFKRVSRTEVHRGTPQELMVWAS